MAHNFNTIDGWHIVGIEGHNGLHIIPLPPFLVPMWFWKLTCMHPFTLGDKQKPTVMFNGVPSVTHQHEPTFLWPHIGIIPDPLDALTPLHLAFGSHKCWLPRGAVQICGEKSTCCVIGGPVSLNADCWEYGKWPTSLVLNPGTVQTTPTVGDFLAGAVTLAIDLVIDLAFEAVMKVGGAALKKYGGELLSKVLKKGDDVAEGAAKKADDALGEGMEAAAKQSDEAAGEAAEKGAKDAADGKASDVPDGARCEGGHPVDLISGDVVDRKVDLALPGAIPFEWRRHYSSKRALERNSLGRGGWAHNVEQWVERTESGRLSLRSEDGRDIYFRSLREGEGAFHRMERLTLTALGGGAFEVENHKTRLTRRYLPEEPGGRALLRSIQDAHGNTIHVEYSSGRLRRVIDTAGREVRVKMTHGGRIARLEVWVGDSLEQWVDYAYAKMGELASVTDALGHTERYEYDEEHRMVKVTLKNGVSFHYTFDPETGRCAKTWGDEGLHTLSIAYDLENRVTRVGDSDEPRIIHWNESGLVVREETPDGIAIRAYEYDADNYVVAHSRGDEVRRFEYDARGNKTREIDPAGNVTEWEYQDDRPRVRIDPDGHITKYEYTAQGSLYEVTTPQGTFRFVSDERGRLASVNRGGEPVVLFAYDPAHNLVEERDAQGPRLAYTYDGLGRALSRIEPSGRRVIVEYDRLGRPTALGRPDGTVVTSVYDPLGNPVRITDPMGNATELRYGGTGWLTSISRPDGNTWRFAYTPRERLRAIENPRRDRYEFRYDTAGRPIDEKTFDGRVLRYAYSASSKLKRIDYPDGSFRAWERDKLGRVTREESTDGPISFTRDRLGRLLRAVVEQDGRPIVTRFERDVHGQVIAEIEDERPIRFAYDDLGRRTTRVMPNGDTAHYQYDVRENITQLSYNDFVMVFERDRQDREIARRDAADRFAIRNEYDSMDRLIEQRVDSPAPGGDVSSTIVRRMWQYDVLGRPVHVEDGRWGATTYGYDAVGRLLEARHGHQRDVFSYDPAGAILQITNAIDDVAPDDAQIKEWEVAPGNLLLSTERSRYQYDRRSRRVEKVEIGSDGEEKRTEYVWDCRDRLRQVRLPSGERIVFAYDAFGRRTRKEVRDDEDEVIDAVDFLWDGDVLAADIHSRYGSRSFVHAPGTLVPLLQAERGEVYSYVNDHVGLPRELVDQKGRVVWAATYSVWGQVTSRFVDPENRERPGRPVESPFRLLGQYHDEETGLTCSRFRYMDPETARWCSPDPLGWRGGLDLLGFVNPMTEVDPFGLAEPLQIGTMATLTGAEHVGDNLDAHELLQNAWLVRHEVSTGRTSVVGKENPAIAITTNRRPGIHQTVGILQSEAGLNDATKLASMTAQENIDKNAELLKKAMLEHGVPEDVADAKVAELKKKAEAFADEHVKPAKPCKR